MSMIHVIKAYRFSVVVIVTKLRAGRLDVRFPLGAEMFLFSKTSSSVAAHAAYNSMGTGILSWGQNGRCMNSTTHHSTGSRLRMAGSILLHILYAFMVWTRKTGVAANFH
jgi:hypothetical protein